MRNKLEILGLRVMLLSLSPRRFQGESRKVFKKEEEEEEEDAAVASCHLTQIPQGIISHE